MNIPSELKYARSDEWIKIDGKIAVMGITDYAQSQLSDVVYVEFIPALGDTVRKNTPVATIESVKAAADVNTPVTGRVVAVNENLPNTPELVNNSPYDQAWMLKIEVENLAELDSLMSSTDYQAYCEERSH
jgi:glycine cleavage system H protein